MVSQTQQEFGGLEWGGGERKKLRHEKSVVKESISLGGGGLDFKDHRKHLTVTCSPFYTDRKINSKIWRHKPHMARSKLHTSCSKYFWF